MTTFRNPQARTFADAAQAPVVAPDTARASYVAYGLYLAFVVSWFVHLTARIPPLGAIRADLLLVLLISGLIITQSGSSAPRQRSTIAVVLAWFVAYAVLTTPFVEWPGSVLKKGVPDLIKAAIFYFFTVRLVDTEARLKRLVFIFVACQAFRVLEPLYLHFTEGYWGSFASMSGGYEFMNRLSGAPSDVINPNGLANVILSTVPFAHYVWTRTTFGRLAYMALFPALVYALLLTGSRSGVVVFVVMIAAIWLQSRRKIILLALAVPMFIVATGTLSLEQLDRYRSIVSSDTKNSTTAHERVEGVQADFAVAMRRPFFGYGLGTSKEANFNYAGRDIPSHNLFTQALQELGIFGLMLFIGLLCLIVSRVQQAIREFKASSGSSEFLLRFCQAMRLWLLSNVIFSFFSYGLTSYEWYLIAGFAEVVGRFVGQPTTAATPVTPPVPAQGFVPVRRWSPRGA